MKTVMRETITTNYLTEAEAEAIAVRAVTIALAQLPLPSAVTLTEAARMLNICRDTARKLNLRRNSAGLIPYEVVLEARSAR